MEVRIDTVATKIIAILNPITLEVMKKPDLTICYQDGSNFESNYARGNEET